MEYRIPLAGMSPPAEKVRQALAEADPAAILDLEARGGALRIATSLARRDLLALLQGAGIAVAADQLMLSPSVCCGGCSG